MELFSLIGTLVAVGVILWAINRFGAPYIQAEMLRLINAVVIILVVLWLVFTVFGLSLPFINVGPMHR